MSCNCIGIITNSSITKHTTHIPRPSGTIVCIVPSLVSRSRYLLQLVLPGSLSSVTLPKDLDLAVKPRAIDEDKEFSKVVEAALYQYMSMKPEHDEIKHPKKFNK